MSSPSKVTIALVQMRCTPVPEENLANALSKISHAASAGAHIVCLPELFRSQYFCQSEDHAQFALAEEIPGPTTSILAETARQHGIVIVASLFERRGPGIFHNTAAILDKDGAYLGKYRKMHIPDDPLYYEKFYFTPGDLGFKSWNTGHGKIGVCVCWDQWYPEAARLTALQGAEILFYPTAIGWHPAERSQFGTAQHDAWETMQRSHAISNGCFVAAANRVGHETPIGAPGILFWGQSFICGPDGAIIARASADSEEVLLAEIDFSRIEQHRTHWPFFRDRRIDAYSDIVRRFLD